MFVIVGKTQIIIIFIISDIHYIHNAVHSLPLSSSGTFLVPQKDNSISNKYLLPLSQP